MWVKKNLGSGAGGKGEKATEAFSTIENAEFLQKKKILQTKLLHQGALAFHMPVTPTQISNLNYPQNIHFKFSSIHPF